MDQPSLFGLAVALILFVISCFFYSRHRQQGRKIPPGPFQFPIVGNMFQLNGVLARTLANLSQKYGPLMSIKLLNRTIIIVSSPKLAKELFQKYDHTFTKRLVFDAFRALDHHKFSPFFLPVDRQWRNIHKLCKEEIFSTARLNASEGLRQEEMQQLFDYLNECCIDGKTVSFGAVVFTTVLNFLSNTLFSVHFAHYDSNESQELKKTVRGVLEVFGLTNLADFYPVLQAIDPQGLRRRNELYFGKLLETFDDIFSQRLKERSQSLTSRKNDLLEVLLDRCGQNEDEFSYNGIKHLIIDLFLGGTDTIVLTVEWAMAELLKNPEKMKKAAAEIREVIGERKMIQESEISTLPYLQAVVKETYRLHPAVNITGRTPKDDIEIDQYIIPKDAEIFLNIWAINRDSSAWSNPDSFIPERFLDSKIDVKGQHFELLTFGAGRRMCLGMSLGHRMVHVMVASLLHKFDWKLEDGIKPEHLDMSETCLGFATQKKLQLKAIPIRATI